MFTDQMVRRVIFIISFLNKLHVVSFKTNRVERKLYVHFWSQCHVIHSFLWTFCYGPIFLPENLYQLYITHQIDQFKFTVLIWICGFIVTFCFAVIATQPHGLCQLLNAALKYLADFPQIFMPNYNFSQDANFTQILEASTFIAFCGCCS